MKLNRTLTLLWLHYLLGSIFFSKENFLLLPDNDVGNATSALLNQLTHTPYFPNFQHVVLIIFSERQSRVYVIAYVAPWHQHSYLGFSLLLSYILSVGAVVCVVVVCSLVIWCGALSYYCDMIVWPNLEWYCTHSTMVCCIGVVMTCGPTMVLLGLHHHLA